MAVRTKQLALGWDFTAGTSDVVVYTVPAGRRTILKRITVALVVGTSQNLAVYVAQGGGTPVAIVFALAELPGDNYVDHETWVVLEAGDQVHVATVLDSGGVAEWLLSGTELVL